MRLVATKAVCKLTRMLRRKGGREGASSEGGGRGIPDGCTGGKSPAKVEKIRAMNEI
jgi:hypothetical protein